MAMTHVRECTVTGKRVYETQELVERAVEGARKGRPLRSFRCKACRCFHITRLKRGHNALERSLNQDE